MMRTVVASLALATSVASQATPAYYVYEAVPDVPECANITANNIVTINGTGVMVLIAGEDATSTAEECATAAGFEVVADDIKACILVDDSTGTTEYKINEGASAQCPISGGDHCVVEQFCVDDLPCRITPDPTNSYCPFRVAPTSGKFLKYSVFTNIDLSQGDSKDLISSCIAAANGASEACALLSSRIVGTWVAGKKSRENIAIADTATACVATEQATFKTAFQDAIEAHNKLDTTTTKVTTSVSIEEVDKTAYNDCFDDKTEYDDQTPPVTYWACHAANAECTSLKCKLGDSCSENDQCGSSKCAVLVPTPTQMKVQADDDKVCVSGALSAIVVPLFAAALAVAFF